MPGVRSSIFVIQLRDSHEEREREQEIFRRSLPPSVPFVFVDAYKHVPVGDARDCRGVIIAGSKLSAFGSDVPNASVLRSLVHLCRDREVPLLGICFGAQFIARALGGEVAKDPSVEEFGTFSIRLSEDAMHDELLRDMPESFFAQCAHEHHVSCLPEGAILLASSDRCKVQAFRIAGRRIWGLQFHPERLVEDMVARYAYESHEYLRESPEASVLVRTFVERVTHVRDDSAAEAR